MQKTPRLHKIALSLIFCLVLPGCMTTWQPTQGAATSPKKDYSATLPDGWIYRTFLFDDSMKATRDGPRLQHLEIFRHPLERPLPLSEQMIPADIGPEQLAEKLLAEAKSDDAQANLVLSSISPVTIGNLPGSMIEYSYADSTGLKRSIAQAAVIRDEYLYLFIYSAPKRHYYDLDRPVFRQLLETFKFIPNA